jgi:hypothetical protein
MIKNSCKIRVILGTFVALTAIAPLAAEAFYQTTEVEGTVNEDIGGVWLAVYHMAPTFRVRIDTVEETKAPWKVGPIGSDLVPLMGENPRGVVITDIDASITGKYSVFQGDIITKINTVLVNNVDEYNAALQDVKEWFLVNVRRPQLQNTKAQLVKIKYEANEVEENGVSIVGSETVRVRVLLNELPFHDDIEKARRGRKLYQVSAEQIDALRKDWFDLETPEISTFINGEHRVVAASDYDQSLRRDDALRDTRFAIISQLKGNPLAGQVGQAIGIYGVLSVSEDKITGTYVESTLASAPFPISIDFNGTFTMTRIDDYNDKDVEALKKRQPEEEQESDDVETAPDVP